MGFFQRFFKKVEDVNEGKAAVSELDAEFYLESPEEEAMDFWVEIAQNIIVNVVKATNNTVDRAFVLVDMRKQPSFNIFYQRQAETPAGCRSSLENPQSFSSRRLKTSPRKAKPASETNDRISKRCSPNVVPACFI